MPEIKYHTYQEYIAVFLKTEEKALRNYYKTKAKNKFPKEYKKTDFPRKPTEKYPYQHYVNQYHTAPENKRHRYKFRAKSIYANQFNEKDFE